jgi:hypothetical protein
MRGVDQRADEVGAQPQPTGRKVQLLSRTSTREVRVASARSPGAAARRAAEHQDCDDGARHGHEAALHAVTRARDGKGCIRRIVGR